MSDIELTDSYELAIVNGDFAVSDSEAQSIKLLFDTTKGNWTQNKETGIGAIKWRKGTLDARFEREIALQLEADGFKDLRVDVIGNETYISKK
jgi:hypothetical protein